MAQQRLVNGALYAAAAIAVAGLSPTNAFAVDPIPAFSGATGPGAIANGGRGGDVYHVTRLDADKDGVLPGSLMYGAKNAPSAGRTIVFDVGGTIYLPAATATDTLRFNWGNITIAGQTAPGPGITIAGTGTKWTGSDVILRNISVRPNKSANPSSVTFDSFSLQLKNSIVDHVSATWFTDEGISLTDAGQTTTVQYANISEGLHYDGHAFGSIISTEVDGTQYSFNHNLYAHLATRMPAVGSETGANGVTTEFSNNVLYNWSATKVGYGSLEQNSSSNFIGNYYINGYNQKATNLLVADTSTKLYQSGNMLDSNRDGTISGFTIGSGSSGSSYFRSGDSSAPVTYVNSPFSVNGAGPETRESADVALQRVLDYGGANWQNRSPIDTRLFDSVRNVSGANIKDLSGSTQSAEWTTLMNQRTAVSRPANWDTDRDGIPDLYELAHGTNPAAANNNGDFDNDGYTDLEEYINDLGAWPAPGTLNFTNANANGRYAQIGNWGNVWQPSRFDAAQISSGTVIVDAPGQDAKTLTIGGGGASAKLSVVNGWIDIRQTLHVGASGSGTQTVQHSGGLLRAGTSVVLGGSDQSGVYQLSGGTLATPLLTTGPKGGTFSFTGGVLHADEVTFSLTNNGGTIAPGSDGQLQKIAAASMPDLQGNTEPVLSWVGTTRIRGNLTLASGVLEIDLASLSLFDKLTVDNLLTLGGGLSVMLDDGYLPGIGDRWLIGTSNSITGQFDWITPGFTTQITGGNLYLVMVPEPASLGMLGLGGLLMMRRKNMR